MAMAPQSSEASRVCKRRRVQSLVGSLAATVLGLAVLVTSTPASPAVAVIGGEVDGNDHPFVGGLECNPTGEI